MSKFYVSEQELKEIFKRINNGVYTIWPSFEEWLECKIEKGEIELVEFNYYEVSKLDYRPVVKPMCGNVYSIILAANRVLKESGKIEKAQEMCERLFVTEKLKNYDEALPIIMEYVEVE